MAIGNAPWPIGVTMVGIHARTGREKIFSKHVAHVLNDETQRKYIQVWNDSMNRSVLYYIECCGVYQVFFLYFQGLKRLMTICQKHFPTDPSKCVEYNALWRTNHSIQSPVTSYCTMYACLSFSQVVNSLLTVNIHQSWEHTCGSLQCFFFLINADVTVGYRSDLFITFTDAWCTWILMCHCYWAEHYRTCKFMNKPRDVGLSLYRQEIFLLRMKVKKTCNLSHYQNKSKNAKITSHDFICPPEMS